jgi:hypothetical protein
MPESIDSTYTPTMERVYVAERARDGGWLYVECQKSTEAEIERRAEARAAELVKSAEWRVRRDVRSYIEDRIDHYENGVHGERNYNEASALKTALRYIGGCENRYHSKWYTLENAPLVFDKIEAEIKANSARGAS